MCKLNCFKRLWRKPTTSKRATWKYWIISATWNIIKLKRKHVSDLNQILYSGEAFYFCCNLAIVSPFRRFGWSYKSSGGVSWLWGYIGSEENLFCSIPWIIVTLMNLQCGLSSPSAFTKLLPWHDNCQKQLIVCVHDKLKVVCCWLLGVTCGHMQRQQNRNKNWGGWVGLTPPLATCWSSIYP